MSGPDLSISIVSYNTREYLRQCLDSILENAEGISFEVIVVDNASHDGSADAVAAEFPSVRVISNSTNRFFTEGHNQALAIAQGQYFLILNPDTLVPGETLKTLSDFLKRNEQVGAVTCREIDAKGKPVITSTRFPSSLAGLVEWTWLRNWPLRSVLDNYLMSEWNRDTERTIEVGTGCFLMVRTSLLKRFGGFDESIKLYYSEHDLCQQIAQQGSQVRFLPKAHYVHFGQRSSSQESFALIRRIHFDDMRYYFAKYHGKFKAHLLMAGIRFCRFVESVLRRVSWRFVSARRKGAVT